MAVVLRANLTNCSRWQETAIADNATCPFFAQEAAFSMSIVYSRASLKFVFSDYPVDDIRALQQRDKDQEVSEVRQSAKGF